MVTALVMRQMAQWEMVSERTSVGAVSGAVVELGHCEE